MGAQVTVADDLRDPVRDYRDPRTTALERHQIREWWRSADDENQMHAMLLAAQMDFRGGLPNA